MNKITKNQIVTLAQGNDFDHAMTILQALLGIEDVTVRYMYFERFENPNIHWKNSTPSERIVLINQYMKLESKFI